MRRMKCRIISDTSDMRRYEVHYSDCDLTVFSFDSCRCLSLKDIKDNAEIKPALKCYLTEKLFRRIYGEKVHGM